MKKIKAIAEKMVKAIIIRTLKTDANRTTCAVIWQPKAPEQLSDFRKDRR